MSLRLNNILTPRYYISSVALALVCIGLSACQPQSLSCEDCLSIHNDQFWNTAEQTPLYSQGGGIFRYTQPQEGKERYFWYGMHYKEAETYRNSPTQKYRGCTFESVTITALLLPKSSVHLSPSEARMPLPITTSYSFEALTLMISIFNPTLPVFYCRCPL